MRACVDLVRKLGGNVVGVAVLIELVGLKGRATVGDVDVHSVIRYD